MSAMPYEGPHTTLRKLRATHLMTDTIIELANIIEIRKKLDNASMIK